MRCSAQKDIVGGVVHRTMTSDEV